MKLQNTILSGAIKYCKKPVDKMEDRNTNFKPKFTSPGFTKSTLESFFLNHKMYQAVVSVFNFNIFDSDGGFKTAIDELTAGQVDLVAKQIYFNCYLLSWLGCIEDVGRTNNTLSKKSVLPSFAQSMSVYGFPELDGDEVAAFGEKFISALKKVPNKTVTNPYFPLYLHDLYFKGLFYVERQPLEFRNPSGKIIKIEDPTPFMLEVTAPDAHKPNYLNSHPQAYLASFYHLNGKLEASRITFKAIIEALTNKLEESQPFILQSGYSFEVNITNQNKARVVVKVATTPKNCCDPFWDHFGFSNAEFFDFHKDKDCKIKLTDEIENVESENEIESESKMKNDSK